MSDFLVIPAIELRGGMALRYESTGMGTRANRVEPVGFARKFVEAGARMIHVFNLDGPFIVSGAEHSGSVLAGAERFGGEVLADGAGQGIGDHQGR